MQPSVIDPAPAASVAASSCLVIRSRAGIARQPTGRESACAAVNF
jgi:hypothetical protein